MTEKSHQRREHTRTKLHRISESSEYYRQLDMLVEYNNIGVQFSKIRNRKS